MITREYFEYKIVNGKMLFETKPKTQIEYIIEAIKNFHISMLEVLLDDEIKYDIFIEHISISKSKSKDEFIAFLNNEFDFFKKNKADEVLIANLNNDGLNIVSICFDIILNYEALLNVFEFDNLTGGDFLYTFFLDIYVDDNKKITHIRFSDEP